MVGRMRCPRQLSFVNDGSSMLLLSTRSESRTQLSAAARVPLGQDEFPLEGADIPPAAAEYTVTPKRTALTPAAITKLFLSVLVFMIDLLRCLELTWLPHFNRIAESQAWPPVLFVPRAVELTASEDARTPIVS